MNTIEQVDRSELRPNSRDITQHHRFSESKYWEREERNRAKYLRLQRELSLIRELRGAKR